MTDHPKRMANLLNVMPELLREFLAHLSKPDDETVTLYADGSASPPRSGRFFDTRGRELGHLKPLARGRQ